LILSLAEGEKLRGVNFTLRYFKKCYVYVTFIQIFTSDVSSETHCVLIVEKEVLYSKAQQHFNIS
jgi:hypothetical protein